MSDRDPLSPNPDAVEILADWSHDAENCAICADGRLLRPRRVPAPTAADRMNISALIHNVGFGIILWAMIGLVVRLIWQWVT